MALFGDLKYIPFTELITPLVKRTGWLTVRTPDALITLEIDKGNLIRAFRDQQSLSLYKTKEALQELVNTLEAPFEFTGFPVSGDERSLNYYLPNMMLDLSSATDHSEEFIDPGTRFRTTDKAKSLPGDLGRFFFRAAFYLREARGVSCDDLAEQLNLPVADVLKDVYALRQMGYIAAVDAFQAAQAQQAAPAPVAEVEAIAPQPSPVFAQPAASRSLVQRLLDALLGRTRRSVL
ncbi:MAG: DUF4388 domain-containing protein [Meiothermus sp.]|nr:DUF4388 domain-containing protein [Meiothermus sp.]